MGSADREQYWPYNLAVLSHWRAMERLYSLEMKHLYLCASAEQSQMLFGLNLLCGAVGFFWILELFLQGKMGPG